MATQKTELILTTSGGERVKLQLQDIGKAGEESFRKVEKGAQAASAHLKVVNAAVDEVKSHVESMGGTTGRVLGAAGGTFGALAVGVTAAGAAAGAAAVGFAALYRRAAESAGGLKDASERTGFHTEKLQEISFAFRQAGVDNEQLTASLAKFSKNVGDARRGTGDLYSILKDSDRALLQQLVSVGSNEKAFGLLADKIATTTNQQDQATISQAAFGRSGTALLQVLRGGSEELERSARAARKFGLVMDESLITKGDDSSDAMDLLAESIKTNLYQAVLTVGPELQTMAKTIAEIVTTAREGQGIVGRFLNSYTERGRTRNEIADLEAAAAADQRVAGTVFGRLFPSRVSSRGGATPQDLRERADELRRMQYEDQQRATETLSPASPGDAQKALDLKIREAAAAAGIDETIFRALIKRESAFNQRAVSNKGAIGLAQLMPGTAAGLDVNPNDPEQNLTGGARYLRQQLNAFGGNYGLALAAYNAGPGNVRNAQRAAIRGGLDPNDVSAVIAGLPQPGVTGPYVQGILGDKGSDKLGDGKGFAAQLDAYKRALAELTTLEVDAYKSGLAGVNRLMAERAVAYTAWNKLADEAQLSEAERARGNLAIWTSTERDITAARADEADKRRKAIQTEANYIDEQIGKAAEEQAKLYAKPFENFLEGVQQGFADLGTKILEDGKITSAEWTGIWKQAGARLISELLSLEFNQAIAVPLLAALKGGGASTGSSGGEIVSALGSASLGGSSLTDIVSSLFVGGSTAAGGSSLTGSSLGGLGSLFSGSAGTLGLLTLGLGAAQSGGGFRITPTSGGLLGLSAIRAVAPYLANTSYGASLLASLGDGQASQLVTGVLGLTRSGASLATTAGGFSSNAFGAGASFADGSTAISQQALTQTAGSLATAASTVVSIVGSLYSLYSSVDGTIKANTGFRRAVLGDDRAATNFAAGSYTSLAVGAGTGALVGSIAGTAGTGGNPIGTVVGALAGAAVGAAVAQAVNSSLATSVGRGVSSYNTGTRRNGVVLGLSQNQLENRVGHEITQGTIGYLNPFMQWFGQDDQLGAQLFSPDVEDLYDKILTRRLSMRGAGFNRHLTVLGQGTTRAGRDAVNPMRDDLEHWAYFLNQLTGAGTKDGRLDRTTAILYNTLASRTTSREQAQRLLNRGIRGFFGGDLGGALDETSRYFMMPGGAYRGNFTQGNYRDRVGGILGAFAPTLPAGADLQKVLDEALDRYSRVRADRVERIARAQAAEGDIGGDTGATFGGFSNRFRSANYTAKQRRGLAAAENQLGEASDSYRRGAYAAQFGESAGFRTVDANLAALFRETGSLRPGQFAKRLPDLIGQITDQTAQWGQQLAGLIDTLRQVDTASASARLSLGDTIDQLLVASGQGGTDTAARYTAERQRLEAGLPLAQSGGARVGVYTSLVNTILGESNAHISDLQERAAQAGVPQLASLASGATDQRIQLEEAGMGPARLKRARRARLDAALAKFRSATGPEKAVAAQELAAANAAYYSADQSGRGRKYALGIATEVSGVTDTAAQQQRALEEQVKAEQAQTAAKLQLIQPKLAAAFSDQAKGVRDGLLKAGLSNSQIDAAIADPVVASQIVQTAQLDKLTKLLEAIESVRDVGTGTLKVQIQSGRDQATRFVVDKTGGGLPDLAAIFKGFGLQVAS